MTGTPPRLATQRLLTVLFSASLVLGISGCTLNDPYDGVEDGPAATPEPHPDSTVIKRDFTALVQKTADMAGGTWDYAGVGTPDLCGTNEDPGFTYWADWERIETVNEPKALTELVRKRWKAQGYDVTVKSFSAKHRSVSIHTKSGDEISFQISDGKIRISATSGCYAGDWAVIRDKELKEWHRSETTSPTPSTPAPAP